MEDQLKQIFVRLFGVDSTSIGPESSPKNIPRWDSLAHINLVTSIEECLAVQFSDEEIPQMTSFRAITDLVKTKL
jgi:acyl carrier protein